MSYPLSSSTYSCRSDYHANRPLQAAYYAVSRYDYDEMHAAFDYFKQRYPHDEIRAALWNVTEAVRKPFLDMQRVDIQRVTDADVVAGFGFAQAAIRAFKPLTYVPFILMQIHTQD